MAKCIECGRSSWFQKLDASGRCEQCKKEDSEYKSTYNVKTQKKLSFNQTELGLILTVCDRLKRSVYISSVQAAVSEFLIYLSSDTLTEQKINEFISILKKEYLPKQVAEIALGGEEYNKLLDDTIKILISKV